MISEYSSNILSGGGPNKIQSAYFCSKCGNLYDITNINPNIPTGNTTEIKTVSETNASSEIETPKEGSITVQKQKGGRINTSDVAQYKKIYFVCETCGNTESIQPRTLIFSKKSQEIAKEYFGNEVSPENIINMPTLPHTRDYICPNSTCKTHAEPGVRDAIMSRVGNSLRMMYICTLCLTSWK